jgi:hypothetical protein
VVLFEGQTEEQAMPIWAQRYWGTTIHEPGDSMVCNGGWRDTACRATRSGTQESKATKHCRLA